LDVIHIDDLEIDQVKVLISITKEMLVKKCSIDEFATFFKENSFIEGLVANDIQINHLYRARPSKKLFSKKSDLVYPESNKVIRKGRCNNINESIFYAAASPESTIFEIKSHEDPLIILIKFDLIEKHKIFWFPIGVTNDIVNNSPFIATKYNEKLSNNCKLINKHLREEFTKNVKSGNEDEYNITIAIYKFISEMKMLYDGKEYPYRGIVYPSNETIKTNGGFHVNVAFNPDILEDCYKMDKIFACVPNNINNKNVILFINEGYIEKDNIIWRYSPSESCKRYNLGIDCFGNKIN